MKKEDTLTLKVYPDQVLHTMQGGIGASWHAISRQIPNNNHMYKYPVREENNRGSAWGGNPPIEMENAWKQIRDHASWLGLDFMRVELSQRMYEPERNRFDWENEEMQALYKILDWCESSGTDVFLQQMWHYVAWNSIPGVHPLLSAPSSIDDFATGIGTLLDHLINTRGYSCIKYISIANEPPGGTWGYWWSLGEKDGSVTPALRRVKEEIDSRGLNVILSGPDWTDLPPFEASKIDFDEYIGSYDIHSYQGIGDREELIIADWVKWARQHNKPFFLTEFGNMQLGWGKDDPGPKTFEAALSNAEGIMRGLRQGVDAFNRWSFTNRGDLDGQWQMVLTFDRDKKEYFKNVNPEPIAYYGYGILTRFAAKHADIIRHETENIPDGKPVFSGVLRNPDGKYTVYLVNRDNKDHDINLDFNLDSGDDFNIYQVTEYEINNKQHPLNPIGKLPLTKGSPIMIPARSITAISQVYLTENDPGIIYR